MAKQTESLGTEHLLPFEAAMAARKDGDSGDDSTEKLFSILESDPVLGDDTSGEEESEREDAAEDADDERESDDADATNEDAGDGAEDEADDEAGESDDDERHDEGDDEDLDALYERLRKAGYKRRVKVAGEDIEADLAELEGGYSRTADYTRKTTETKQERDAYRQARDKYAEGLTQLDKALAAGKPKSRTAAEWDALREEDPTAFAAEWADQQRYTEAQRELDAERAKVERERRADAEREFVAYADGEAKRLHEKVPEFADPKKGPTAKRQLVDYLTGESYGFTDDELKLVVDHRLYVLAEKARKYDALKSGAAKDKIKDQRDRSGRPVLKPAGRTHSGAKPKGEQKRRAQLRDRLRETGGRHDVAEDLVFDLLGAEEERPSRRR